ncbi:MerR family transcriptional regulator [Kitasatospora xanthocidica]|uniref:MerR family transcriptional regulator n=1 Tax=Kitasatospora xanthocidica TaxID=83382 RepID=UPI0036EA3AE1
MRIGELARRTGTTPRALRYYEEQGLLTPERRPSGYREYGERDLDAVHGIRTLLAAGLNSAVIAEILPGLPPPGGRRAGPTCPELLAGLARERARITRQMDELAAARALLDTIMGSEAPSSVILAGRSTVGVSARRSAGRSVGRSAAPSDRPGAAGRKPDGVRSRAVLE